MTESRMRIKRLIAFILAPSAGVVLLAILSAVMPSSGQAGMVLDALGLLTGLLFLAVPAFLCSRILKEERLTDTGRRVWCVVVWLAGTFGQLAYVYFVLLQHWRGGDSDADAVQRQ